MNTPEPLKMNCDGSMSNDRANVEVGAVFRDANDILWVKLAKESAPTA